MLAKFLALGLVDARYLQSFKHRAKHVESSFKTAMRHPFDGRSIAHLPGLSIDDFRAPDAGRPAVAAYLLSHVHSDHLAGISLRDFGHAPVYCTSATKKLLFQLQTRSDRILLARGDLEAPKYTLAHARRKSAVFRVLPFDCPTTIVLADQVSATVTALEANHCPGGCIFLIQTSSGHSILYTGDMRADSTLLTTLSHHPLLVSYVYGSRALDCIYLDTSSGVSDVPLEPKVAGCHELAAALAVYPPHTRFFMPVRTLGGVEELWAAASTVVGRIHVDSYHVNLYRCIRSASDYRLGPLLAGVSRVTGSAGHATVSQSQGILTSDVDPDIRFHSCDAWDCCRARQVHAEGVCSTESNVTNDEVYIKLVRARYLRSSVPDQREAADDCAILDDQSRISITSFAVSNELTLTGELLHMEADLDRSRGRQTCRSHSDSRQELIRHSSLASATEGDFRLPKVLVIPFSRHSTLVELRAFIKLFGGGVKRVITIRGEYSDAFTDLLCSATATTKAPGLHEGIPGSSTVANYCDHVASEIDWSATLPVKRRHLTKDVHF
ncbi:DNA cross-link repair protein PSO2/SNM1 [Savitreella phatthalungensis]